MHHMNRLQPTLLKITVIVLFAGLLVACATRPPAPVDDGAVAERVRAPAPEEPRGLQIRPLRNPAVTELTEAAQHAENEGDLERAALLLERALRIEPRDPELLQHLAEISFNQQDWEQAESHASRSFDVGPRVGELCRRNWQTIALAREQMGFRQSAGVARERLQACRVEPPPRY
jgi:Flp pilus assembly protein TadD